MSIEKISIREKLSLFHDHWHPRIVGELNGQHVKLAKFKGEFVWHKHDAEDELFYVLPPIVPQMCYQRLESQGTGALLGCV
jgi:hypothetical protein